jgi:predicted transcriptional regulator
VPGATVRIKEETRTVLRELARQTNQPMQEVLARAVEAYRRQQMLAETNAAYAALRADPELWRAEQAERAAWEATLADGLEAE